MKILAIVGSLRKESFNKMLLKATQKLTPKELDIEEFDIAEIPLFNQDLETTMPEKVTELKNKIKTADGILFITPEYNYGLPGVLKNAIDWASRPYGDNAWEDKNAMIMGASSGGFGTLRAQMQLRQSFIFLNIHTLNRPEFYVSNVSEKFDQSGNLVDEDIKKKIIESLDTFSAFIKEK